MSDAGSSDECDTDYEYTDGSDVDMQIQVDMGYQTADEGDPEHMPSDTLSRDMVREKFGKEISDTSKRLEVSVGHAELILNHCQWRAELSRKDRSHFLVASSAMPVGSFTNSLSVSPQMGHVDSAMCAICCTASTELTGLHCLHLFCRSCWNSYITVQLEVPCVQIKCMFSDCHLLCDIGFVLDNLSNDEIKSTFSNLRLDYQIQRNWSTTMCPGVDCDKIVCIARQSDNRRTTCQSCESRFCFNCGHDYHAPNDCVMIKNWLLKCQDDSETARYITLHTKDCPNCNASIEKNGGCNHMVCSKCNYDFCWTCLTSWKKHAGGPENNFFNCSKYKEELTPDTVVEERSRLAKYLHYYTRWSNHRKSLDLEVITYNKLKDYIDEKVATKQGSWIDWQYLKDACNLLSKGRHTLQYSYAYAYFLPIDEKHVFELQQLQLETSIENLSWKVERAQTHDKADIHGQMRAVHKWRLTLLTNLPPSNK